MSKQSDIKGFVKTVSSIRQVGYDKVKLNNYINSIKQPNSEFKAISYTHGITAVAQAYSGGVYSPTQNFIYLVPFAQSNVATWHYIDCNTGSVVAYVHGFVTSLVTQAYAGGAYSPTQNRIYFAPRDISTASDWHYVNCNTGVITAYTHGGSVVANAYVGACYSPTQNRIYFSPFGQSDQTDWHFINCDTGALTAYTHGTGVGDQLANGAVYSPSEDRIYYIPFESIANVYFINCSNGTVGNITNTAFASGAYLSASYSPTLNRIYLNPANAAPDANWHYIDCNLGTIVSYANGLAGGDIPVANAYFGSVFDPTTNKIYLIPSEQGDEAKWHYIDCETEAVVAYVKGVTVASTFSYSGGVYSPTQNRIYLVPRGHASTSDWHYIKPLSAAIVNSTLMSGALFNKL